MKIYINSCVEKYSIFVFEEITQHVLLLTVLYLFDRHPSATNFVFKGLNPLV